MTRIEELRKKFRPQPIEEPKYEKTLEEALAPYLEDFKDYSKSDLMALGGQACGCMGPQNGNPLCHCGLIAKAQEILLDKWYKENMK